LSHQEFDLSINGRGFNDKQDACGSGHFCFRNVPMKHCANSFALILRFQSSGIDFSLCYSGDSRPCKKLVQACHRELNVNGERICLFIHEATFDDDQPMEAMKKFHCTVSEALGIFEASGAEACILTHFSQRYPRLPPSVRPLSSRPYGMATDGMLIPFHKAILADLKNFNNNVHDILEHMECHAQRK
jgi:ribonuclease Z